MPSAASISFILAILVIVEAAFVWGAHRVRTHRHPGALASPIAGAGVVFMAAMLASCLWYDFPSPWLAAVFFMMSAICLIDDFNPLPVAPRFVAQVITAAATLYAASLYSLPLWAGIPLLIAAVAYVNAYNFMDGINGMTALYSAVLLGFLLWVDLHMAWFAPPGAIIVMLMAIAVFAPLNVRPRAICFAGDVGSVTMGFFTLLLLCMLIMATGSAAWLAAVAVYGVDACCTIVYRAMLRQPLTQSHKLHLYQRLTHSWGIPAVAVSAIYAAVQLAIDLALLAVAPAARHFYLAAVVAALVAVYALFIWKSRKNTLS